MFANGTQIFTNSTEQTLPTHQFVNICESLFVNICGKFLFHWWMKPISNFCQSRKRNCAKVGSQTLPNPEVKLGTQQIATAAENLLTGVQYAFQRKDGVLVVPVGCFKP
jgi:hypothetical protein